MNGTGSVASPNPSEDAASFSPDDGDSDKLHVSWVPVPDEWSVVQTIYVPVVYDADPDCPTSLLPVQGFEAAGGLLGAVAIACEAIKGSAGATPDS